MAEAGQKDQTGNEAVAPEDANLDSTRPQSMDDFTGLSKAATPPETKPEVKQTQEAPKNDAPAGSQPAEPAQQAPTEPSQTAQETPAKPVQPTNGTDSAKPPSSKFLENEWQQALLRHSWHMDDIDNEFSSILKGLKKNKDDSLTFETKNGKFLWGSMDQKNATGGIDKIEYIGLPGRFSRLTQELADDQMKAAKAHGWKAVNLHGSDSNKEKMWLAAKRAGLEVANFLPPEGSPVLDIWKKESAEITGLTNANNQPQAEAPKVAEPPKAEEPKAAEPPKVEEPAAPAVAASEPPKVEEPKAAEPPKVEEPAAPAVAASEPPAVEEPKAAEPPKVEEPAAPAVAASEPPKVEEPKAAEPPKVEEPAKPAASKFGSVEQPKVEEPKAEEPKAAEPPKANPAHADWEAKRPSAPQDGEAPWRHEERMKYEAVDGLSKRAAAVQDPAHREGIEKLQDAIKSGKVSVDGPIEREIINNVDSPKGFQKAADYFGKKAGSDLGLPKVDAPAAAENTAPKNTAPKNKGPA